MRVDACPSVLREAKQAAGSQVLNRKARVRLSRVLSFASRALFSALSLSLSALLLLVANRHQRLSSDETSHRRHKLLLLKFLRENHLLFAVSSMFFLQPLHSPPPVFLFFRGSTESLGEYWGARKRRDGNNAAFSTERVFQVEIAL